MGGRVTGAGSRAGPAAMLAGLVRAMRPRQWAKNLFVFAALVFTDNIPTGLDDAARWHRLWVTLAAFALFCVVSSAVYLMNDVADREQDRLHPEKRHRPIAAGVLPWQVAAAAALLLGLGGTAASYLVNPTFGLVATGYLLLQVAYNVWLKHAVLLDVFAIAAGFVLRAVAGAAAIDVLISVWLLVCMFQLALFLGFGKRRHELVALADGAASHRQALEHYSLPFIDQMISIVLGGLTVSYAVYSITSATAQAHPLLVITLPSVFYGIFRYLYLIHIRQEGGSPETILLRDRQMQVNILIWLALAIVALKVGPLP